MSKAATICLINEKGADLLKEFILPEGRSMNLITKLQNIQMLIRSINSLDWDISFVEFIESLNVINSHLVFDYHYYWYHIMKIDVIQNFAKSSSWLT